MPKSFHCVGITGTLGAGKGEVVKYLKQKGYADYSARDFIVEEVVKRGFPVDRDHTTLVANALRSEYSPSYIIESLYRKAEEKGQNCIIESVRALGELAFLRKHDDFHLLAVDADPHVRYERVIGRKSALDQVTFETFLAHEKREMLSKNPTEGSISDCMKLADFTLVNDGTREALYKQIDTFLAGIEGRKK